MKDALAQGAALGADTNQLPKVQELRERLANDAVDIGALEADVYDHLYRFFSRYYQEGDFISLRRYKEGVYAIPYEGEEVKLHWANHDQYYVKTAEYLRDYAFRLRPDDATDPMRVHFRLVDAAEGEHGKVCRPLPLLHSPLQCRDQSSPLIIECQRGFDLLGEAKFSG